MTSRGEPTGAVGWAGKAEPCARLQAFRISALITMKDWSGTASHVAGRVRTQERFDISADAQSPVGHRSFWKPEESVICASAHTWSLVQAGGAPAQRGFGRSDSSVRTGGGVMQVSD